MVHATPDSEEPTGPALAAALGLSVVVWALTCLVDGQSVSDGGLGALFGAVFGAGLAATLWVLTKLEARAAKGLGAALGMAYGLFVAGQLGALDKVGGEHGTLAMAVLVGGVVGGAGLGGVVAWTVRQPPGRTWLAIGWLAVGVGAVAIDRMVLVGVYKAAHDALRFGGLLAWVLAAWVWRPPGRQVAGAVAVAVLMAPVGVLGTTELNAPSQPLPSLARSGLLTLTDWDGDGYGAWLGGGDCAPMDASRNPGAAEVPGNGIDDNCRWGDAEPPHVDASPAAAPTDPAAVSVLLITIDTLRPDHMGIYGYERPTTPHIDRWAKQHARVFDNAYTTGGWTSLAISSMMRGVYPRRLEWQRRYETNLLRLVAPSEVAALPPQEWALRMFAVPHPDGPTPLAEHLRRRGVRTAAAVYDGYSQMLSPQSGVALGFEQFLAGDQLETRYRPDYEGDDPLAIQATRDYGVSMAAVQALKSLPNQQPFFLWLHLFTPHGPNLDYPDAQRFGGSEVDGYDHMIQFADAQVCRVLEAAQRRAEQTPLMTIIASDHGEAFFADGRRHGVSMSDDELRIPLLVAGPGVQPGRSTGLVSLADVAPTILAATQTPPPSPMDGRDLQPLLAGADWPSPRVLAADNWRFDANGAAEFDAVAVFDGQAKLVWQRTDNAFHWTPEGAEAPEHLWTGLERYIESSGGAIRFQE